MAKNWTTKISFRFVPLPEEKEEAYWATIEYFSQVMFPELPCEANPLQTIKLVEVIKQLTNKKRLHPFEEDEGVSHEAARAMQITTAVF